MYIHVPASGSVWAFSRAEGGARVASCKISSVMTLMLFDLFDVDVDNVDVCDVTGGIQKSDIQQKILVRFFSHIAQGNAQDNYL